MFCPKCGKEVADGFNVCPYCGSALGQQQPQYNPYGQPQQAAPVNPVVKNGCATAGLVFGIIGLAAMVAAIAFAYISIYTLSVGLAQFALVLTYISLVTSIVGVILGIVGIIMATVKQKGHLPVAIVGLSLAAVALLLWVVPMPMPA